MPSAVIEAQYVNPPQPGKKMGSIKSQDGTYYGVTPAMLGMFKQGGTYEVFYEDREFQGKTYHTVKTVKAVTQPAAAAEKIVADVQRARTNEADAERMWVCSLLGHTIAAGKVDALALSDIVEVGRIFRDAQRLIFSDEELPPQETKTAPTPAKGNAGGQPFNEEFGDQVPF